MRFFLDEAKARAVIDPVGGGQDALRPEGDFRIPGGAGEANTLANEPCAQPYSTCRRVDVEQPQLGRAWLLRMANQEDMAHMDAIALGDPTAFAAGIEIGTEG